MISNQAQGAILILQAKARNAHDIYTQERVDRALDEIVRNSTKTNPSEHQARSAFANAAKVIDRRRKLAPEVPDEVLVTEVSVRESGYDLVELKCWLGGADLSFATRTLLLALLDGAEGKELATQEGIPVARVREQIARARRSSRAEYMGSAASA